MLTGDYCTRLAEAFSLKDYTALKISDVLGTKEICRFGCPERIHTDQGRKFCCREFTNVFAQKKTCTFPYHLNFDGFMERFNRTLKQMLARFCHENQNSWDNNLACFKWLIGLLRTLA